MSTMRLDNWQIVKLSVKCNLIARLGRMFFSLAFLFACNSPAISPKFPSIASTASLAATSSPTLAYTLIPVAAFTPTHTPIPAYDLMAPVFPQGEIAPLPFELGDPLNGKPCPPMPKMAVIDRENVKGLVQFKTYKIESLIGENFTISADGNILAIVDARDNTLQLWCLSNGDLLHSATGRINNPYLVYLSVAFSSNLRMWATSSPGGVEIWRATDGKLLQIVPEPHHDVNIGIHLFWFSPDDRLIITKSDTGELHFRQIADGALLHTINLPDPLTVRFSPDWKYLAAGTCRGTPNQPYEYCTQSGAVWLWRVADGKLLWYKSWKTDTLAFTPDSSVLLAGNTYLGIFNSIDGALQNTIRIGGLGGDAYYSPDGALIATHYYVLEKPVFELLDAITGEVVFTTDKIQGYLSFSPDWAFIVTIDDGVHIWGVK